MTGSVLPGLVLGGYLLRAPLGSGAQGEVWAATRAEGAPSRAAVKVLAGGAGHPRARGRLLHEARIAARIDHPNVCRVLDEGEEEGTAFLVLEWVDGVSLRELCAMARAAGEALDPAVAVRVALDAAAGLHAAHELEDDLGAALGVVHRDVSAANLLVGADGVTRVSDFGVAHSRHGARARTTTGIVRGTLRTIAPEQAMGATVDRRADVYALAAVVFDALAAPTAGPGGGRSDAEPGPLFAELAVAGSSAWPATIPRHLTTALRRALARHPDARPRTARALADELAAAAARDGLGAAHARVADRVRSLASQTLDARRRSFDAPPVPFRAG